MGAQILGVGITGAELTELERELLQNTPPYAVVLFGRNVKSPEQLRALCADIKSLSPKPPLIMIDQEGGRVDRLRHLIPGFPSAEAFTEGEREDELSEWGGRLIGLALRYFDIEVNLAPVVDVQRDEPVKGLERRCFGRTAEDVIRLAGAFMRGHQRTGSAVCLKHFPGIGTGSGDPHYGATVIDVDEQELTAVDLQPYVALANEAASVMIGHGTYPKIDPSRQPASLSPTISHRLLRDVVGFTGLAVSDDMEMHAVADLGPFEHIGEKALLAGNDVILFCSQIERVPEIVADLEQRARESTEVAARLAEAERRGDEFRAHCFALRTASDEEPTFGGIIDEMEEFCAEFRDSRYAEDNRPESERRKYPRSPGTGKTGREEWT
jgi:beta-N-acetylhexosaminidase